jgi:trypsin-like peptidase
MIAAVFASFLAAAAAAEAGPSLRPVGVLEPIAVQSGHPYLPTTAEGWPQTVTFPRATYVRIHFSSFDLTPGDWVEVAGPGGEHAARYEGRGPLGIGDFWAVVIPGDTAVVTLHASQGGGGGYVIDGAGRGTVPVLGTAREENESDTPALRNEPSTSGQVCGNSDWQDSACYASSDPEIAEHARGAFLVMGGCCELCTGFKVSDTGQFLVSDVCGRMAQPRDLQLLLDYANDDCGGSVTHLARQVFGLLTQSSDPIDGLDYRLMRAADSLPEIPCLQLEKHAATEGEPIYIPQHPNNGLRVISVASDRDDGGVCRVDPLPRGSWPFQTNIGFMCDTAVMGSSGAPVISATTHRVLGLNHFGGCPNAASRADKILKKIEPLLDGCSQSADCTVLSNGRCNCDGVCSENERRMGQVCGDCH